ncbi:hypothetical protein STAS_21270 [Striga asiatica]|uniref:Agenet domain-containing protein n=1 Tax=Striga asiatica TaxID=4170 RepID=A0A5A7QGC2_STRAF|nr:hypothetical protein STAS_21270 [Striga asiatica]
MGGDATHSLLRPHSNRTPSSSHHHLRDGDRRAGVHPGPFPVRASVEVRTREAGLKDTFFSATVTSSGGRNSGKIQVEYRNLLAGRGRSKLLREYVDVSCVRPPPPLEEAVGGFGPGDAVDALYQDGWWIGIVTRVVEEGAENRYVVTFPNPPDEREFGLSELRVHWDWVNGSWVRPDRQLLELDSVNSHFVNDGISSLSTLQICPVYGRGIRIRYNFPVTWLMFDLKKEVEVSFDREDGQDAWFRATIHQHLGNGMYLVNVENQDPKAQSHQIKVDSLHLRPRPPLLKDKNFVLLGKVDAYFDCGWWSGLIRRELENSRYLVTFKQLNMERDFHLSELRSHMEWKDGKWFTSPQDVMIQTLDGGMDEHHTSESSNASVLTFQVNNFGDRENTLRKKVSSMLTSGIDQVEQLTPDFQKGPHVTPLTKRRRRSSDSQNAFSQCQKKLKEGLVPVEKQQEKHDRMSEKLLSNSVSPALVNNVETPTKQSVTGDLSSDSPSWGMRTRRGQIVAHQMNSTPPRDMKNSTAQTSEVENMQPGVGGKKPDVVDKTANHQNELVIVIGLPCVEMVISGLGKSRGGRSCSANSKGTMNNKEKRNLCDSTKKIEEIKPLELGEFSEKRKRGRRPRRTPTESIQTPLADDSNAKDDNSNRITEVEAIGTDSSEKMTLDGGTSPMNPKDRRGIIAKRTSPRKREEKVAKESMQPERNVSKRGRRRSMISLQVEDSLNASRGKSAEVNSTLKENNADSEAPSIELDDQPLSMWIGGRRIQSPSAVNRSKLSAVIAVEQSIENGEKEGEEVAAVMIEEAEPTGEDTQIQISTEHQKLPFAKTSLLWKTIESLDAFRILPQSPHFQPLQNVKESMREGLAIAHMVNFSSVFETTCKLLFDSAKSSMDDILEILAELELHGFDVVTLRARVAQLISVKDKEAKLAGKVGELNREMLGHQVEKTEIEKEIEKLKEQVRKLQGKLSKVELAKERKEKEIASVGARLQETKQSIENLRVEFDGIAAAAMLI